MKQKPKIVISSVIKRKLDKLKQYPRETYEDVIKKLIKSADSKI
jgi:hypothetical protein